MPLRRKPTSLRILRVYAQASKCVAVLRLFVRIHRTLLVVLKCYYCQTGNVHKLILIQLTNGKLRVNFSRIAYFIIYYYYHY